MSATTVSEAAVAPKRSWWRRIGWSLAGTMVLVAVLPSLLGFTPLRNSLLLLVTNDGTRISTRSASLGWFTSQQVSGIALENIVGSRIDVEQVEVEKSLWRLLSDVPDLGKLTIDRPRLDLVLTPLPPGAGGGSGQRKPTTFRAEVRDISVIVRGKPNEPPVVDLNDMNLFVQVAVAGQDRVLTVDATQLMDQQELTVDMCHRGLELIAPVLASAANVDGRVSLRLDRLRVPLDPPGNLVERAEIEGHLVLHRVSAGLRNPLLTEIARAVGKLLRVEMPSQVKLANEADVHFTVHEGRVFHDGMAFGLPELSSDMLIRTQGSVGLDHSLDMLVDVPIPLDRIHDGPLLRMLSERPLQLQVRGTLEKPVVTLPEDKSWYSELMGRLLATTPGAESSLPPGLDTTAEAAISAVEPLADAVLDTFSNLLDRRRQKMADRSATEPPALDPELNPATEPPPPSTPLLDRFRSLRESRRKRNEP